MNHTPHIHTSHLFIYNKFSILLRLKFLRGSYRDDLKGQWSIVIVLKFYKFIEDNDAFSSELNNHFSFSLLGFLMHIVN